MSKSLATFHFTILESSFLLNGVMNPWFTMTIAAVRYKSLTSVSRFNTIFTRNRLFMLIGAVVIFTIILFIPEMISYKVAQDENNCFSYKPDPSVMSSKAYAWMFLFRSSIPTLSLVVFSVLTIKTIIVSKTRVESFQEGRTSSNWNHVKKAGLVLTGIMFSSLISLTPILVYGMYEIAYFPEGQMIEQAIAGLFINILVTINSVINIVFYCVHKGFRSTLKQMILSFNFVTTNTESSGTLERESAV